MLEETGRKQVPRHREECEKVTSKYFVAMKLTQHEDEVMLVIES